MATSVSIYRGIRYATAARLEAPQLCPLDPHMPYQERGPICPQGDTGDAYWGFGGTNPESEDCLVLSIFTPISMSDDHRSSIGLPSVFHRSSIGLPSMLHRSSIDVSVDQQNATIGSSKGDMQQTSGQPTDTAQALLPVFVMIHGGSYRHGGGERSSQDLEELAALTHTVCVSVSYRFSAFGYCADNALCPPNLGLLDQLTAMDWLHQYIGHFGGDAQRITLCGQSAGAQSIAYMLAAAKRPIADQVILFSAPLGLSMSASKAEEVTRLLYRHLGGNSAAEGQHLARTASTDAFLRAMQTADKASGLPMPFMPAGITHMPASLPAAPRRAVVSTQADDGSFYGRRILWPLLTRYVFAWPSSRYARFLRRQGVEVERHRFSWIPGHNAFKACHCSELLLFLGTAESWVGCRLAGDLTLAELRALRSRFIPLLGEYIHGGEWRLPDNIAH